MLIFPLVNSQNSIIKKYQDILR